MKVLVTGATGFIGSHIVDFLLSQNITVIASSRDTSKAKKKNWFANVTYKEFKIGETEVDDILRYFHYPDRCIHAAWGSLNDFRSEKHESEIHEQHQKFLYKLIDAKINKVSVLGTCLEYGLQEGLLSEKNEEKPVISYPMGKLKLLNSLRDTKHKFDWIRLFYMFGEGQSEKSILPQLNKHIQSGETQFNMSRGDQLRDYLPVEEVAKIISRISLLETGHEVVNCCSGDPISIVDLVKDYLDQNNYSIKLNLGYYPYCDYEPKNFWGDTKKLNKILSTYDD